MAFKAILITKENQLQLGIKYNVEEWEEDLTPGLYMVALFGESVEHFELITQDILDVFWVRTGRNLQNEWFEVKKYPLN